MRTTAQRLMGKVHFIVRLWLGWEGTSIVSLASGQVSGVLSGNRPSRSEITSTTTEAIA